MDGFEGQLCGSSHKEETVCAFMSVEVCQEVVKEQEGGYLELYSLMLNKFCLCAQQVDSKFSC